MDHHFDPTKDVLFRGKLLAELSDTETREALIFALRRVYYLEAVAGGRHQGGWPMFEVRQYQQNTMETKT